MDLVKNASKQPERSIVPAAGGLGRFRQSANARKMEQRWMPRGRKEQGGGDEDEGQDGLVWDVVVEGGGGGGGTVASLTRGFGDASWGGGGTWVCPECRAIVANLDGDMVICSVVGCRGTKPGADAISTATAIEETKDKDDISAECPAEVRTPPRSVFSKSRSMPGAHRRGVRGFSRVLVMLVCGVFMMMEWTVVLRSVTVTSWSDFAVPTSEIPPTAAGSEAAVSQEVGEQAFDDSRGMSTVIPASVVGGEVTVPAEEVETPGAEGVLEGEAMDDGMASTPSPCDTTFPEDGEEGGFWSRGRKRVADLRARNCWAADELMTGAWV